MGGITSATKSAPRKEKATSCGTLVLNKRGELLLCHVTGTAHWDIPKGLQDAGESTLEAARRELREETGLEFDIDLFEKIGSFDNRPDKRPITELGRDQYGMDWICTHLWIIFCNGRG